MNKQPDIAKQISMAADERLVQEVELRFAGKRTPNLTKTTFRLTQYGYDALNDLAVKKGSNVATVLAEISEFLAGDGLEPILGLCTSKEEPVTRIRRSYSVERKTLRALQEVMKHKAVVEKGVSRDELIETTARIISHLTQHSVEKEREKLKEAQSLYFELLSTFSEWHTKIRNVLADFPDHAFLTHLSYIDVMLDNLESEIREEIDNGVPVDPNRF